MRLLSMNLANIRNSVALYNDLGVCDYRSAQPNRNGRMTLISDLVVYCWGG